MWLHSHTKALKKYGHISEWNTSKVTSIEELFKELKNFNDDISKWDVSDATDMEAMFSV
jgi:surface protein